MIYCKCGDDAVLIGTGIYTLEFTPSQLDLHRYILSIVILSAAKDLRPVQTIVILSATKDLRPAQAIVILSATKDLYLAEDDSLSYVLSLFNIRFH